VADPARRAAHVRGHGGESLAAWWLRLKGYRILGRRIKTHDGEIDLAALSPSGLVCFVEVKARAQARAAAESVSPGQKARIVHAASLYLASRPRLAGRGIRFDIMAVTPFSFPRHWPDA